MPLSMTVLKNIFYIVASIVLLKAPSAFAFNPFSLGEEFNAKLNSQALLKSTRFYARGYSLSIGQNLTAQGFEQILKKHGYRQRSAEQVLTANDFMPLDTPTCQQKMSQPFTAETTCYQWMNEDQAAFILAIQNDRVFLLYSEKNNLALNTAALNPILVAQYRNNEPLLQEERKLADFPVSCLNAVIAIEDNEFLDHSGVSYSGLARAFFKNLIKMRKAQGGSTITQQLVKNYFLTPEKTLSRKAKEIYMASRLESEWTKDEILQTYLNIIYMGQSGSFQVRGFPSASRYYFNKPIDQLNLSECALLAAIINNPGLNNPWKKTEKSQQRRKLVLTKMLELQLISQKDFDQATIYPMPASHELQANETAPYFLDAVKSQAEKLGIQIEGKSFFTTLDLGLQDDAEKSLQNTISQLTDSRTKLKNQKSKGFELQGVVMMAENSTGYIKAFVGGQNYRKTQFNRALNSRRQIGSLMKPFVYLSGLINGFPEDKNITPETTLIDQSFEWIIDKKNKWSPDNYDKKFRGEVPYYYALKESLNSPTAQVAYKVGLQNVISTAMAAGFQSNIENSPSVSLGANAHFPIEVLQAYSTLAKLGQKTPLTFIEKIVDEEDQVIFSYLPQTENVFDSATAAVLVGMMKQSTLNGTAKAIGASGIKAISAGKTGTTSNGNDAWFAGFTPMVTTVTWIGFDQNTATYLTGASGAVPVWISFMKKIDSIYPMMDFNWPESVELKKVKFESVQEEPELIFKK